MKLVTDNVEMMRWFAERHIAHVDRFSDKAQALGVATDAGALAAVVVYDNFRGRDIEMSVAAEMGSGWCSRSMLWHLFAYPFVQIGCDRVTAITPKKSKRVRKFLKRLGFVEEGRIRKGFETDDAMIYGMLKDECAWIGRKANGQVNARSTADT
jgi:hypothetical protein